MTEEQLDILHAKVVEIFGDNMAHPEHEPIRFNYQIKIALFKLGWKVEKK